MLNIDLEPLKQLYQEILNTQGLTEKELKELERLIKALQETKEEFENSSFSVLEKNTELFKQSNTILQNIKNLSIFLDNLEDKIKKEKITFNDEIKKKMENMLKSVENNLDLIKLKLKNRQSDLERNFKQIEKLYSDNNAKLSSLTQETKKIGQEYSKLLESSLNGFKKQITQYKEEFEDEIKKKTLLARWGAVAGAFAIGVAVSFIFLIPTIKAKIKADKIVQEFKIKNKKDQEIIIELNKKIEELENSPYNLNQYKSTCTWNGKDNIPCIAIPVDKKHFFDADTWYSKKEKTKYVLIPTVPVK